MCLHPYTEVPREEIGVRINLNELCMMAQRRGNAGKGAEGAGGEGAQERENVVSHHTCEMVAVWLNELRSAALAASSSSSSSSCTPPPPMGVVHPSSPAASRPSPTASSTLLTRGGGGIDTEKSDCFEEMQDTSPQSPFTFVRLDSGVGAALQVLLCAWSLLLVSFRVCWSFL